MSITIDSDYIKNLRKLLGYSQTKLAEHLGVSMRTVQNWEGGQRNIPDWAHNVLRNMSVVDKINESADIIDDSDTLNEEETKILRSIILNKEKALLEDDLFENWLKLQLKKHEFNLLTELEAKGVLKKVQKS